MTDVQAMIHKDGRRQLWAGGVLTGGALLFLIGLFSFNIGAMLYAGIYSTVLGVSGTALLRTGFQDLKKAKNTTIDFSEDHIQEVVEKLPSRMYMGHEVSRAFQSKLYDMAGEVYGEIIEDSLFQNKWSTRLTEILSYGSFRSANYLLKDVEGDTLYRIEKKGGFSWRGYVQHKNGNYVAYTKEMKNKTTGQRIYRYIEKNDFSWSAEGDDYIGHFKIKDPQGNVWAVLKHGAVPIEAPDRFHKNQGSLIDWKEREKIPQSLLAFMFLLQTKHWG